MTRNPEDGNLAILPRLSLRGPLLSSTHAKPTFRAIYPIDEIRLRRHLSVKKGTFLSGGQRKIFAKTAVRL